MPNKIAIIDDNSTDASLLMEAFRIAGYSIDFVYFDNSKEFLKFLQEDKDEIGLFIIDLCIDELDGIDILKKIKETKSYRKTPIIICSGSQLKIDIDKSISFGAANFFRKPFDFEDLKNIARTIYEFYFIWGRAPNGH